MSPEDQARFGVLPNTAPTPQLDRQPTHKTTTGERKEQATFANWLLLQNGPGRKIPFCWHATQTRSKASPGTPDFWVGVNGHAIWFEFKVGSNRLTSEQEEFRQGCVCQEIEWHLVYSAQEAIEIVQKADARHLMTG
jgi:hypothetical protein